MTDYFIWNGTKSTDYGIHVSEHPPITVPSERQTYTSVPGRPGSLTTLEGDDVYDDMTLTCTCWIEDSAQIPKIAKWLKGSGKVTFATRLGGYYQARVTNQLSFEQVLKGHPHRTFAVNFRCKPFWYQEENYMQTHNEQPFILNNPGSVYSEPIITVYGSGDITLAIGSQLVEINELDKGSITLDTPLMEAYNGTDEMNSYVNGEFPTLSPGNNTIAWTGDVTKVEILPNWRTL